MADWNYSDYQAAADKAFADSGKGAATVSVFKNGLPVPAVAAFPDSAAASSAYDALVAAPGSAWYVALYDATKMPDKPNRVDETYFGGLAVTETVKVKRPVAAIVATGVAAMLAVFAGRKRSRR